MCLGLHEYTKVSFTNIKYDIKNLTYITRTLKSVVENMNNVLENDMYKVNNMELIKF